MKRAILQSNRATVYQALTSEGQLSDAQSSPKGKQKIRLVPISFLLFAAWFLARCGDPIMYIHTPTRAAEIGLTKKEASYLLSIYGGSQALTCIPWGLIYSKMKISATVLCGIGTAICGISTCVSVLFKSFAMMCMHSFAFGIGSGKN